MDPPFLFRPTGQSGTSIALLSSATSRSPDWGSDEEQMTKVWTLSTAIALLFWSGPANAHLCVAFQNTLSEDRSTLFATYLRANLEFPQHDAYIRLKGFATYLQNPVSIKALLRPAEESEAQKLGEAMNRAHTAFGVEYRTDHSDTHYKIQVSNLKDFPDSQAANTFRRLVRIIQLLEPGVLPDINIYELTRNGYKGLRANYELMTAVDRILADPNRAELRTRLKLIGMRMDAVLSQPEIRDLMKAYRIATRDRVREGYRDDELEAKLGPSKAKAIQAMRIGMETEFAEDFPTELALHPYG